MYRKSDRQNESKNESPQRQSHAVLYPLALGTHVQFKVHSGLASRSGVSLGQILDDGEAKRRPSGQTVGWMKMKLGTEVGLGPGHIVLDGDPAPPPLKGQSPQLWSMSVAAKRLDG